MTGIEPALPAWEAGVLPMNYIREAIVKQIDYSKNKEKRQDPNLFFYLSPCRTTIHNSAPRPSHSTHILRSLHGHPCPTPSAPLFIQRLRLSPSAIRAVPRTDCAPPYRKYLFFGIRAKKIIFSCLSTGEISFSGRNPEKDIFSRSICEKPGLLLKNNG